MTAFILNENVSLAELNSIGTASGWIGPAPNLWPTNSATLPAGITLAVLIVRPTDTVLEHARAVAVVSAAIRIICVYTSPVTSESNISKMYCSSKVEIISGSAGEGLSQAISGSDKVQDQADGKPQEKSKRKRHNC